MTVISNDLVRLSNPDSRPDSFYGELEEWNSLTTTDQILLLLPSLRKRGNVLCRSANDADDLVQDTLLRAIAKAHQFQPGTNLKAWLFTIMRNRFYSAWRVTSRESPAVSEDRLPSPVDNSNLSYWNIRTKEVAAALSRIGPKYRVALLLVTVQGETYEDACRIADCNIGTLKSRISRGRAALKLELGEA
ncbi:sigma-70 family RNA polymerase sigma factor [Ketogulonicigenium vulgare]|uniref:sigma-70 family RNA polymerase sigma factor n=1 Tax=Ketogulonicigenium vulgare TaxID=92945 RepID=UPI002359385B|nr:sigma-70 family RNA polymerase sigma factor [Ketogulonicigenium vulgare]